MRDFVSGMNAVLMSASLIIVAGILFTDLPWGAFIFVSVAASIALWMTPRTQFLSIARLLRGQPAEPVRAFARARGVSPVQQQLSDRKDPRA